MPLTLHSMSAPNRAQLPLRGAGGAGLSARDNQAARRRVQPPTRLGATMTEHRHPPENVSNDSDVNNLDPCDGLESLQVEMIDLEAFAHAAAEAAAQLPFPSGRENRRVFDHVYTLINQVAEQANKTLRQCDQLVAAVSQHRQQQRTEASET